MEKECDFYIYPNGKIELSISYNNEVKRYMSTEKINLDKLNKLIHKRNCKENQYMKIIKNSIKTILILLTIITVISFSINEKVYVHSQESTPMDETKKRKN